MVGLALLTASALACAGCALLRPACPPAPAESALSAPPPPACDDNALTSHAGLLVLAPHPDDETLAFAGLRAVYQARGKPVRTVVVTDGDAYCPACSLWKSGSTQGETCDAEDLSNLATPEVDSFAEVRRLETADAAAAIGLPPPELLGYPDTGLRAAWNLHQRGRGDQRLRRSDFSACRDCATCTRGWGQGPETDLTPAGLVRQISDLLAAAPAGTLVATTHWLDAHGDHAALGRFVQRVNDARDTPLPVAYAVIHAHTPKDGVFNDCWYPAPAAPVCECADERCAATDPERVATLADHRLRPEWPAALPDDAFYGDELQLCLPPEMYRGEDAGKLRAVLAYPSQRGSLARDGTLPAHLDGIVDCSGYLLAFVRSTEAFVLPQAASCEPAGTWRGLVRGGGDGDGGGNRGSETLLTLELSADDRPPGPGTAVSGTLTRRAADGGEELVELAGRVIDGCRVELDSRSGPPLGWRGTASRDGFSLYVDRPGGGTGFFTLHRAAPAMPRDAP